MPKLVSTAAAMHIGLIHEKIAIKSDLFVHDFEKFVRCHCFLKMLATFSIKVEKILKGNLDSITSPSRSYEHLNFLFLFFWPNVAGI